ncbi:hypothetical protein J2Z76_000154 [Sedimentibacter acidaminivorans]|uniref:DUF6933 domain-containing protein n=1 Tax=Sedimentibacter acidaminivorans TaxID=913099 RepID=A0ABS4G9E2_9FIRM|nr:SEC-C metal-binding domain-containing protein [Sedimentibacter acidaminivorans]MBP1924301.1 hypothetical protein [Sedimentibacter acidaminivorans]
MLIKCTKKLLEQLNIKPEIQVEHELLFSWHANLITVNRRKAVVLMNDKNNYIIVLYGLKLKDFKNLNEHIFNAIRATFKEECINEEVIDKYINNSQEILYSKTSSRSMISKLNNACIILPRFDDLLEGESIYKSSLGVKLSRLAFKNSLKEYILPCEEMYKDLETFTDKNIFTYDGPIYKVIDYIISLTHLYGLVHKNKVIEIYNMQNEEIIDEEIINYHIKKYLGDFNDNFVKIHSDYFVHELIMEFDNFYEQLRQRKGKPFYIPDQEELFNYIDDNYIEINKEYKNLLKYVTNNILNGDKEEAESLVEDIHNCCHQDFSLGAIFGLFNERDISFKDGNQVNETIQLIMDMANNIRIWENNGFTPKEIFEIMDMSNLSPFSEGDASSGSKPNLVSIPGGKIKKIGRNDPCPCGSGKKYKKCCGKLELS